MRRIVYLPVGVELAQRLRKGGAGGPWRGYAATPGLRASLSDGDSPPSDDELEYAALDIAGLAQVIDPPRSRQPRLVLAAEVEEADLLDRDSSEPGAVTVAEVSWRQVTAVFADPPDAVPADAQDLLWYAPEELDSLLGR